MRPLPKRLLALLAVLTAGLALTASAHAAEYTVTNTADDIAAEDCEQPEDSLRCALVLGYQPDEHTVIDLSDGATYDVDTDLTILSATVTINGNGSTLAGAGTGRIFAIGNGSDVTLNDLVLTGGVSTDDGGAISNYDSALTINRSTLTNNEVDRADVAGFGGAVHQTGADASLTMDLSTVADNTADGDNGGYGGGIAIDAGTATITRSTIAGNSAPDGGGGLFVNNGANADAHLDLTNSTVTGNTAADGPGLFFETSGAVPADPGDVSDTITQSTIAANGDADAADLFRSFYGDSPALLELTHSMVAGCATTESESVDSVIADGGNNLDTGTTCGFAADRSSATLNLTDLTSSFFGGPQVLLPKPGSPAIDNAGTTCPDPSDERPEGFVGATERPIDGNGDGTAQCDVGAVEYTPAAFTFNGEPSTETTKRFVVTVTNADAQVKVRVVYGPAADTYPNSTEVDVPYDAESATVNVDLTGLTAAQIYHYRVQVLDGASTFQSADAAFGTKPVPGVSVRQTDTITETTAKLNGRVDDNGLDGVKYHFEYGPTTAYGTSTPEQTAAKNVNSVPVSADIAGLTPGTRYNVRLVVNYDGRTFTSANEVFTTKAAAAVAVPPLTATAGKLKKISLKKTKKFSVSVTCSKDCALVGKITTTKKIAKKLKRKKVLVRANGSGEAGTPGKVTFKLSKKLRKKLKRKKVKSLEVNVIAAPADGDPVSITKTVKLTR